MTQHFRTRTLSLRLTKIGLLALCLFSPGCEIGRSWFSMSSDSPSPWFGIDLMPRRRTSQTAPRSKDIPIGVAKATSQSPGDRPRTKGVSSKELRLPSIPAFFDTNPVEELSFHGPEGTFSK